MSASHRSILAALTVLGNDQIQQAGHRYTPGVDPNAPNLRIKSLFEAIENVACGAAARERFESVLNTFFEAWEHVKYCSQHSKQIQSQINDARTFLPSMMSRLRNRDKSAVEHWSKFLSIIEKYLLTDVEHWRKRESDLRPRMNDKNRSPEFENIRSNIGLIDRCLNIVLAEKEYIESPSFKVLIDPNLLISGEWGTGKTHLMCDFLQDRTDRNKATVLVLAKNFQDNIVAKICHRIARDCAANYVFDQLEKLANQTGERTVVIVDGVNEGIRAEWKKAINSLQALVADRPTIGLILTCRTLFETIAINKQELERFHKIKHFGFDDQEFDAQATFFEYYNLPLTEVPLLNREFSRPLTLKLICQSLQNLTGKKLSQGFAGIASGQKGLNYVLESFVNNVGKSIECQYDLRSKGCWGLLKGSDQIVDRRLAGFAPCMAENLRTYVRPSEADRIVAAHYPALRPVQRRQLLEVLRTNGLIEEDALWCSTNSGPKPRIVFRLPYQRFSDHLIARHLLKMYLDVSSAETIRHSFTRNSPLARIFRISNLYNQKYAEPGLAEALITEFPERVGMKIPSKQRELLFVLPLRNQRLDAYFNPFIEGIFWRNPATFTEGTSVVINQYLNAESWEYDQIFDALVAVATKPKHPYRACRLYDTLMRYPMPNRDLRWSEYLRRQYASPTIRRLLTWAGKLNVESISQNSATELVVLLSLVLTTVVRSDRDLVTKALVLIGERFPKVLFSHVLTSLEFNDPYVPERMLAAAYGTTLSLVDSEAAPTFRPRLGDLAITLYRKMFGPNARNATHHAMMRDYALGIIEVARHKSCVMLPKTASRNLVAPFPNTGSTFTSDGTPDPTVCEAIDHAIQMDFGNYTIGRLIPNRNNYDNTDPEYIQVLTKIKRRIYDLGYRTDQFKHVDQEIDRSSWNAPNEEKVDRYGKKYSWIAYYEMWGEREAHNKLPDRLDRERISDCGIDPSFPKRPPDWKPQISDLLGDSGISTEEWVKGGFTPDWHSLLVVPEINSHQGEWVLLEGYVLRSDQYRDREIFTFLRGMFIADKDVGNLKRKFMEVEYPGNDIIPPGAREHYLFAGEAGRRLSYARQLCQPDGRYRGQIGRAFDQYVRTDTEDKYISSNISIGSMPEEAGENKAFSIKIPNLTEKRHCIPGVRIEIPHINFGWESYHSPHNDFSGFNLPAPSLIQRLHLFSKNREVDFYDSTGKPGTLYREAGDDSKGDRHHLLYIRADLLQRYLSDTRKVLVWCNWGERDWLNKMEGHKVIDRQRIYQDHGHIHRSFSRWSAKDREII